MHHFLKNSVLVLAVLLPIRGRCAEEKVLSFSIGLSDYKPNLEEVRDKLRSSGGGRLAAMDEYRGKSVFISLATYKKVRQSRPALREVSYLRYRAQSGPRDFLLELDRFSGSLLKDLSGSHQNGWLAYWGGGITVMRMKREGEVESRGSALDTRKDWLGGLNACLGLSYLVSDRIAIDARYTRDLVGKSTFNGVEYSLSSTIFSYALVYLM